MLQNLYKKNHLRTFTGRYINLLDPDPTQIFAADIAVGLARTCRFGGHTKKFYSVAEHSDWCRHEIDLNIPDSQALQFKALMHDAHEYILCDIPSPLKEIMPEYDGVARLLQQAINTRFGLVYTPKDNETIAEYDRKALEWEWENKVEKWTGFEMDEKSRADIFLHHFVKLCKVPHVLQ